MSALENHLVDGVYHPRDNILPVMGKAPSISLFPLLAFVFDEDSSHEGHVPQHTQHCVYFNCHQSWSYQKGT
jgi:hypothetical protein